MKKIERNHPCPCGSGKKYKQCCLKRDETLAASKRAETISIPLAILEASEHHQAGRLSQAETLYRQILQIDPEYPDALHLLGVIAQGEGRLDVAIDLIGKAIKAHSLNPSYYNNLGIALQAQGKQAEAAESYRKALSLNSDYVLGHNNLGNALKKLGKFDEAIEHYTIALSLKPDYAEAHNNLGAAFKALGKLDQAVDCYYKALSLKPDYTAAHNNIGVALQEQGKLDESVMHCRQALLLDPELAEAHLNLGNALKDQGGVDEAISHYRQALSLEPKYTDAHTNLIFTMDMSAKAGMAELFRERKKWDETFGAPLWRDPNHDNDPIPTRCLRIGYVSADFRGHSAARVFGGMLTRYDRAQFEVFAYSNLRRQDDEFTELFKQNVTSWRDIVDESDEAVALMIRDDKIDILVDLSGHSGGNRLLVFARKPAPIQITAWGYATGTGMRAMDVFLTDPVMVPPQDQQYFSEQVRYLPSAVGSFGMNSGPEVNELPALRNRVVTFGSFNRLVKVTEEVYRTWAEILLAVPQSRLILKAHELSDSAVRKQVIEHFLQAGVAAERVIMLERTSWHEHMRAYNQIDIALDPFPHGGGVTAIEGLVMGVPVISLRWPTVAGRLSASIMTTLGQPDWIVESREEYVKLAVQKAADLPSLAGLRQCLRIIFAASVIGDQTAYVRAVEQEYQLLWQEWCAKVAGCDSY